MNIDPSLSEWATEGTGERPAQFAPVDRKRFALRALAPHSACLARELTNAADECKCRLRDADVGSGSEGGDRGESQVCGFAGRAASSPGGVEEV